MAKNKPQKITETVQTLSPWELEGPLVDIRDKIDQWIKTHGTDANLDWDPHNWESYDPSPSPIYKIKIIRHETEKEMLKRLESEKLQKELIEQRELAEFERLKVKFLKGK